MSTATWVGLFRNALCCVKDLFPSAPFLSSPIVSTPLGLLPPFSLLPYLSRVIPEDVLEAVAMTTVLEAMICPLQFYAMIYLTMAGYSGITSYLEKAKTVPKWAADIEDLKESKKKDALIKAEAPSSPGIRKSARKRTPAKREDVSTSPEAVTRSLAFLEIGLQQYKQEIMSDLVESVCCLMIGPCFLWLGCNSLHVTTTPHIGGITGVINALIIMEAALVPLLFGMGRAVGSAKAKAEEMESIKEDAYESTLNLPDSTDLKFKTVFDYVTDAVVLRDEIGVSDNDEGDEKAYDLTLTTGFGLKSGKSPACYPWYGDEGSIQESYEAIAAGVDAMLDTQSLLSSGLPMIEAGGEHAALNKYRDYMYLLLNLLAFWGYLMAPITFYLPETSNSTINTVATLGMADSEADWLGNFVGDLCWTIEPAIILFGGWFVQKMLVGGEDVAKGKKEKSD